MSFQFLVCQLTCGFFLHKSRYVSISRLCMSIDVHFVFVQVFACQKRETCKNFVKHIHCLPRALDRFEELEVLTVTCPMHLLSNSVFQQRGSCIDDAQVNLTSSGLAHLVPKKVDWDSMDREKQLLVQDEPVKVQRLHEIYWSFCSRKIIEI